MAMHKQSHFAFLAGGAIALLAFGIGGVSDAEGGPATTAAAPMNALSVEPRVPRLGITPCVVELFDDLDTSNGPEEWLEPEFQYTPPAACPGPWAKVILSVDLSGPGSTFVANVTFGLGVPERNPSWSTVLMVAGVQFNRGQSSWRVERDITEYSALLRDSRPGYARYTDGYFRDPSFGGNTRATGRMIFYPATAAQPAPEIPDVIVPFTGGLIDSLPRNIERAYLDIHTQHLPENWFSCVPSDAAYSWPILVETTLALGDRVQQAGDVPGQGCAGGSYRDVVVRIDGQQAGVAPLYPWLNSDLNRYFERSVDLPVPTPQSLNLMPYRVDLTPFAALLSDGGQHVLQLDFAAPEGVYRQTSYTSAQLMLYLDHGSTQVTGQVTRNTMEGRWIETTIARHDWRVFEGTLFVGDFERIYRREFEIAGYVNTSKGRVDTTVKQEQLLSNTQHVELDGVASPANHDYAQRLNLVSLTERTVLRQRGSTVLAYDRIRHHYPLQIDYSASGGSLANGGGFLDSARAKVSQGHHQQGSHYRPAGTYADRVYANFVGGRDYDRVAGTYTNWHGARSHYFHDSAGSCHRERVTWLRDALTSHTQGVGCANGFNRVRGFAHPDGSPDNLGWLR